MRTPRDQPARKQLSPFSLFTQIILSLVCLFVAVLSVYSNSLDCSWHYDDAANITNNASIRLESLSWEGFGEAMFRGHLPAGASFRPVAYLSFALNFFAGGLNVFGYHVVNLLLHCLSSLFLFLTMLQILELRQTRQGDESRNLSIALAASLLWAVHPVQTQAVTYVVQRMALLAGMFFIASLFFYLKARKAVSGGRRTGLLAASIVCFLLALGTKENAIMLLPTLGLCEFLLLGEQGSLHLKTRRRGVAIGLGVLFLLGLLFLQLRDPSGLSGLVAGYEYRPFTIMQRLMTEPRVLFFYVSLLFYPAPERMSIAHDIEISTGLFTPASTLAAVFLIFAVLAGLSWIARRQPIVSFAYLFFFLNHMVESTFLPLELVYEHRNYTPSMFFFLPPVIGLVSLTQWRRSLTYPVCVFLGCLVFAFGLSTYLRNFTWKTPASLWSEAVKKAPRDSRAHHNLGLYHQETGNLEAARAAYEKALACSNYQRRGAEALTLCNLAGVYRDLNECLRAEHFYKLAVSADPNHYRAFAGLAALYQMRGEGAAAYEILQKGLAIKPDDPILNFNAGLHDLRIHRVEEAIAHFDQAVKSEDSDGRSPLYLGIAYKHKGELGRAFAYFLASAEFNPNDITPRLHILEILQARGFHARAREEAERIVARFMSQPALFIQVVNLISEKGDSGEVHLSGPVIFPVLREALAERRGVIDGWMFHLDQRMK